MLETRQTCPRPATVRRTWAEESGTVDEIAIGREAFVRRGHSGASVLQETMSTRRTHHFDQLLLPKDDRSALLIAR
jgi:hypothetical protein